MVGIRVRVDGLIVRTGGSLGLNGLRPQAQAQIIGVQAERAAGRTVLNYVQSLRPSNLSAPRGLRSTAGCLPQPD